MTSILILKTGALGDVLRTTSLLPGMHALHPDARVTWLTAQGAAELVQSHPLVARVETVDSAQAHELERVQSALGGEPWDWLVSLDDEEPLCRLAAALPAQRLSGATFDTEAGRCTYTDDSAPWFDMGLLSVHGKEEADRRKVVNERSHPEILATMLGLAVGRPSLAVAPDVEEAAVAFAVAHGLGEAGPVVGLNTGAGGRWHSKTLPVERTVELAARVSEERGGRVTFLLLGGRDEEARNRQIAAGLEGRVRLADAGTDNGLMPFAALVSACDLLVTSDSLALHVAVARDVPVVAFFAPTSAAEIELFGRGEKVVSTASDYCSYRPDADTSTLTVERLAAAVLRQLGAR